MTTVQFDGLFAFVYSDRPNAPALQFNDKISEKEKSKRLQILLELQENITREKNQALVGSIQPILVEGRSKKQSSDTIGPRPATDQWTGRTTTNKIVNFNDTNQPSGGAEIFLGKIVPTRIEKAYAHSLWGTPVEVESAAERLKGENSYAA
jgi:tRNA-2-methylthio-N6-dimethylallyladenosine synthase